MRCNEIVIELDAYLTAELDAATTAEVERHLKRCLACRIELQHLRKENELYRAYGSPVGVQAEAWSQIQARTARMASSRGPRLEARSGRLRRGSQLMPGDWRIWASAALVLLVLGLSLYLSGSNITSSPDGPETGTRVQQTDPQITQVINDLQQALGLLQSNYIEKKHNLDPGLVAEVDGNLEVIRDAIGECKHALREQPDSDQATQFLLLNYEKEISTLRQIMEAL